MNIRYKYFIPAAMLILLSSCFKDESSIAPVPIPVIPGRAIGQTVMGSDYLAQVYYDLGTQSVVGTNNYTEWDLGFECKNGDFHIILNYAKNMSVLDLGLVDFNTVSKKDTANSDDLLWSMDRPDGNLDSTALGRWWNNSTGDITSLNHVYIIDRGNNERGRSQGIRKFRILGFNDGKYKIRFADLDGKNDYTLEIPKTDSVNFVYAFLEKEGKVLFLEPDKSKWDFVMTRYITIYYDKDNIAYGVTGPLLNRNGVKAIKLVDSLHPALKGITFDSLTYKDAATITLSSHIDAIGFDWKYYDLQNSVYYTYSDISYIIQDTDGLVYKFHFIDFLSDEGVKGYPKFEFELLLE